MNSNAQVKKEPYFTMEAFLLGGFSILTCFATWTFTDRSTSLYTVGEFAFLLAFAVNHPHFLASYILLYGDFRKKIKTQPSFFWAGVFVPVTLAGFIAYAFITRSSIAMSYIVSTMFFSVGWHYVKQIFGCVIVTCARRKMYFSKIERRTLLFNLFSLWALSWIRSQTTAQAYDFYGIKYGGMNLPPVLVDYTYYAIVISAAMLVYFAVKKYIYEGQVVNSSALMSFGALYVWYLPTFSHPAFAYLIPMFHSLQYSTLVWSYKKNQVTAKVENLKGVEQRRAWVANFVGFGFLALVLGILSFELIPKWLDSQLQVNYAGFGPTPILVTTLLFINIHHYFIDNVLWRSSNPEIKAYLFAPTSSTEVHVASHKKAA